MPGDDSQGQAHGAWQPPLSHSSSKSPSTDHFEQPHSSYHNNRHYQINGYSGFSDLNMQYPNCQGAGHNSNWNNTYQFPVQHNQGYAQTPARTAYAYDSTDRPGTYDSSGFYSNYNMPPVPQSPSDPPRKDLFTRQAEEKRPTVGVTTQRGHHTRNSSWSAPKALSKPVSLYAHRNNTVDNITTAGQHQQHTSNYDSRMTSAPSERKARMSQIYGFGQHRNMTPSTSSSPLSANSVSASVSHLKYSSRNSSSSSLRSGASSFVSSTAVPPIPPIPSKLGGSRLSKSQSNSSSHAKNLPHSIPEQPAHYDGASSSFFHAEPTVRRSEAPKLPPLDTIYANSAAADSAPVSVATTASIRNLMTPPTPLAAQSEPSSPYASPNRGFSMPKLFSRKSARGESHSRASSNLSRSNSPSLASRIGSRISSGSSSRFGSRSSTGSDTPSTFGTSSLNPNSDKNVPSVVQGIDDDWPDFTPRRQPKTEVLAELGALGSIHGPSVDIDVKCRQPPLNTLKLGIDESTEPEVKGFLSRGLYYYHPNGGTTGENGNYQHVVGEHVGFRYEIRDILGKGSFGTVYKCRDHKSGRMVAVKITANRAELQGQAKIEANMLRSLMTEHQGQPESHHFVRFVENFKFKGHFCIATEMLGPNSYELLSRNNYKGLEELSVRYITRQLCEGLEFLTIHKIIHCDLKPENILVSDVQQCQVKIVDFGSGCYEGKRLYTYIQSRFYRAPEILLGMPYSFGIDMWSLGAIVAESILGKPLFPSVDENDQVALMAQVLGPPDAMMMWRCTRAAVFFNSDGYPLELRNSKGVDRGIPGSTPIRQSLSNSSPDAINFVENVLQWAPEARLKADKAVYHPFVSGH